MTQANVSNYLLAQQRIKAGLWRVDLERGWVLGVRGLPFRRINADGYVQIKFRDPVDWWRERAVLAHRVIWESAHGSIPRGLFINHLTGDRLDNRLVNLELVTASQNMRHAIIIGTHRIRRGEENSRAKLDRYAVLDIYRRAHAGESQRAIGAYYGVDRSIVSNIKHGWRWSHVTGHRR